MAEANLPSISKICSFCEISKPLERFKRDKTGRHGRNTRCKDCSKVRDATFRRLVAAFSALPPVESLPKAIPATKQCTRCKVSKPLDKFIPDTRYLYGCTAWCRECKETYIRQWGKLNAWKNQRPENRLPSKTCAKCQIHKAGDQFDNASSKKGGLASRCKQCREASQIAYRSKPETKLKNRLWNLYKLSVEQFEAMIAAQQDKCAICEVTFASRRAINIDHCHSTLKIRGLLCSRCNSWIAPIEHPTYPLKAVAYLSRHL